MKFKVSDKTVNSVKNTVYKRLQKYFSLNDSQKDDENQRSLNGSVLDDIWIFMLHSLKLTVDDLEDQIINFEDGVFDENEFLYYFSVIFNDEKFNEPY